MVSALSMKRMIVAVFVALLLSGVLALAGCSCTSVPAEEETSSSEAVAPETAVPDVVEMMLPEAREAIRAAGLDVGDVERTASETVPKGAVMSQDPAAGANVARHSKVNLVVSSGTEAPEQVKVPDLTGRTQEEAKEILEKAGLIGIADKPEETDEAKPGTVFKQSVAAGTEVDEGTEVRFTVAQGAAEVTVPGVIGQTRDAARSAIVGAKLKFDSKGSYSESVAKDRVISQSVVAGTKVKEGTVVTVELSLGPEPVAKVKVPDVVGKSTADARSALGSVGLSLDTGGLDGTVTGQKPAAGTSVDSGTTVSVTVKTHDQEIAERFVGVWDLDDVSVDIDQASDGFVVTIEDNSRDGSSITWKYVSCEIDGDTIVSNRTGTKTVVVIDEAQDEDVAYTDGSAVFSIDKNGNLIWKDKKEDAGKGLKFVRVDR